MEPRHGSLVKRLRHRPFTAVTGVQFPYESPIIRGCSSMVEFWPSKPAVRVRSPSPAPIMYGIIAQLGEHLPYKQGVTGSSPVGPTICGLVVQLVRMPACHAGGRGFESLPGRQFNICWCGSMAEQLTCNQQVVGSTPITSSKIWRISREAKGGRL